MRLPLALALVVLSLPQVPADSGVFNHLVVHEWGTFTSVAGEDGRAVEWIPQAGPQDLPCFVDRLRFNVKAWVPGTVRMETPVLYFYSPRDMTVNVSVRFRQGVVTEWFPNAAVTPSGVGANSLRSADFESSITWNDVKVAPAAPPDFPVEDGASHYYTARDTDASPIESGAEKEKFLFYRGVGGFEPPITAAVDPEGRIVVANPAGEAVGEVILFENRGGAMGYEVRYAADSRVTLDPLTLQDGSFSPLVELERILMAHGLYAKEAAAMVRTWRDSWFEEGTRLLYIAPREVVDAILPLEVTPAAAAVERVFVGRIELVTPATEVGVRDALARRDEAALRKYSRFVNVIVERMLGRSSFPKHERARALTLLQPIHASWATSHASCR